MTLGGAVCIRNGNELDFCWKEAVQSLLGVCDEVVICEGESTDNTMEEVREWAAREPKINVCVYPWPFPKNDPEFWVKWLNYAREHVKSDWHFQLDADEVVHEDSYPEIRKFVQTPNRSATVTRWNFWKDEKHLIPDGQCLGKFVVRIAPSKLWMASDGAHRDGATVSNMAVKTGIQICHYGFIRKRASFFKKEEFLQQSFFGTYDPRLKEAESFDGNWMTMDGLCDFTDKLDDFKGTHPAIMKIWLSNRGYNNG